MDERYVNPIKNLREIIPVRTKIIQSSSAEFKYDDPTLELAERLHPDKVFMVIDDIKEEAESVKTFKLIPDPDSSTKELPVFRPGQYLSISACIDGCTVTRPYSISSSPMDAFKHNYYDLTIKKTEGGFFTNYIWNNWKTGSKVQSSDPSGFFYHMHLRDTNNIVGLCGGSGVTPMRSMMRHIMQKNLDMTFTLFYGINHENEIMFKDEFDNIEMRSQGKVKVIYVCSNPDECWNGAKGFLSADLIQKYTADVTDKTFFICGPEAMYSYLEKELPKLKIEPRRIRREVFGETKNIQTLKDFPMQNAGKKFNIIVNVGKEFEKITANGSETILNALEKAGIEAPSKCRSGECGFCRSRLISGSTFVKKESDGRRAGDKLFGYIHPCSTYPMSDIEIEISVYQR